ncbi:MAG: hypothetical protein KF799_02675 [Bdellovibrionales bacterium]|nr:hypothetical protein [Bdellovibrionales bacterium]
MLKKLTLLTLSVLMGAGLVACNERTVAVGAGVVGGAIVAGAVYDNYYGRDYRYSRGYYRGGVGYWDRHDGRYYRCGGRWCRDSRFHPRPWPHHGRWNAVETMSVGGGVQLASVTPTAASREAAVAGKYRISRAAALQVGNAFSSVERYGKMDGFRALGLQDDDVARISQGQQASAASVQTLAKNLNASTASVQGLLRDVGDEYSLYKQGTVEVR